MQTMLKLIERSTGTLPVELLCVPPAEVAKVWPHVADLIYQAMRRGDCGDYGAIRDAVHDARMLLWIVWDSKAIIAGVVTEIAGVNGRKICTIVACGGVRLESFISLKADIEKYAANEGCGAMRIIGRTGWQRVLSDYTVSSVQLEKGL